MSTDRMSTDRQPLPKRSAAISSVCMLGALMAAHLAAGLFLRELPAGAGQITDPGIRTFTLRVFQLFDLTVIRHPGLHLAIAVVILGVLVRGLRGYPIQWALDLIGGVLCVRCLLQFLLLNLLLLAPLKAGGLLLIQLVLFLPVIITAFGWLYWRLDTGARSAGRRHLRFSEDFGNDGALDYFYASWMALLQFVPLEATPTTPLLKVLFVLQGVAMMDLVALTLSRAIGLASGGG